MLKKDVGAQSARTVTENDRLKMRFAGKIVKHLGLQMYSGAVPAIAELIANAWDAEASRMDITIPLGTPFTSKSSIIVRDNGCGMSYDDIDNKYLVIGRDRRDEEGPRSSKGKRRVMAHKGIGKLAGFGIADVVTVTTVRNHLRTKFRMKFTDIEQLNQGETYYPEALEKSVETEDADGTEIALSSFKLERAIGADQFMKSMSRRFAVLSDSFEVYVNGQKLKKGDTPFQLRIPEEGVTKEGVDGHSIAWWVGFTEQPIEEEELRGISIIVLGKMAQKPFYFNLSGGLFGQHGMQYMTGEVQADFLDDDRDLVSSDRMSVLWEDPLSAPLIDWGQSKVKDLLRQWVDLRREKNYERTLKSRPDIAAAIEDYPPSERAELSSALVKLSEIPTIDAKKTEEVFDYVMSGFENRTFIRMIKDVAEMAPDQQAEILRVLAEFDVLEAVKAAQLVWNRVRIIRNFREMILEKVKEKPDMQEMLKKYPWLIEPTYLLLKHESALETVIRTYCSKTTKDKDKTKRLDFLCVGDSRLVIVVEAKRPGEQASRKEMDQILTYVNFLRKYFAKSDTDEDRKQVKGWLIAGNFDEDYAPMRDMLYAGGIRTSTWDHLLETTEHLHREFLDLTIAKANPNDPRILYLKKTREKMEEK